MCWGSEKDVPKYVTLNFKRSTWGPANAGKDILWESSSSSSLEPKMIILASHAITEILLAKAG